MSKTIFHQFTYPQPPEKVWEYLTDSALLAQWLMPNDIQPILGHKFRMQSRPMPKFGFDGIVHCEILELVPRKKLVFSWKGGNLDTRVTWKLSPQDGGTLLKLEHGGFKGLKNLLPYLIMGRGWKKIGGRLLSLLQTA